MTYSYEKEKQFREIIEKMIVCSEEIDDLSRLYEEIFGLRNTEEILSIAEKISIFIQEIKELYDYSLLEFDSETLTYAVDGYYKENLINITKVIESISADDFEKLCALFLKEIVKCDAVNATQRSHDQGIDFVGYKRYVKCLTTDEQNNNLLYVVGQAKHYKNEVVDAGEVRELAGSIYLMRTNNFAKKRENVSDKVIYNNLNFDAFTPIVPYFITSNYFSSCAYTLCRNAAIIAIDRLSLVLNLVFSNRFNGMSQEEIIEEIRKVERIS